MSNLIEFAKQEFKAIGYKPIEELPEDDADRWIQENVIELIKVFSAQGHSGSSAPFAIRYFKLLAMFEPLSPLTGNDDEWEEVDSTIWQNKRLFSVFKDGKEGKPYFIRAIVWREKMDDGHHFTFTGTLKLKTGETVTSRQYIKFPFTKETFYVDVKAVDDETYELLDQKQLDEALRCYPAGVVSQE